MLHLFLVNYSFNKEMQGVVMWHLSDDEASAWLFLIHGHFIGILHGSHLQAQLEHRSDFLFLAKSLLTIF